MKDAQDTIAKKVQKLTQKLNKTLGFRKEDLGYYEAIS